MVPGLSPANRLFISKRLLSPPPKSPPPAKSSIHPRAVRQSSKASLTSFRPHQESAPTGLPAASSPSQRSCTKAIRTSSRWSPSVDYRIPQSTAPPPRFAASAAQSAPYSQLLSAATGATRQPPASTLPAKTLPRAAKNCAALPVPAASPGPANSPGSAAPVPPAALSPEKSLPPPTN